MQILTSAQFISLIGLFMIYASLVLTPFNMIYFWWKPAQTWKQVILVDMIMLAIAMVPVQLGFIKFFPL
jgi:magnesium-transporting ATPase (P-type)